MTAFVVASVRVKDADKFAEYGNLTRPTFALFGGDIIARGKVVEVLDGMADNMLTAVIQFPDVESAKSWFTSEEYQAIIPLRDEASDMSLVLHEVPS